jgi:hypothetical protein
MFLKAQIISLASRTSLNAANKRIVKLTLLLLLLKVTLLTLIIRPSDVGCRSVSRWKSHRSGPVNLRSCESFHLTSHLKTVDAHVGRNELRIAEVGDMRGRLSRENIN